MSELLTRGRVESHLGWLRQRTEALDGFHAANYRLVLNDFCDWFVKDEVCVHLFNSIRTRPMPTAKAWHEQANREGKLPPLPEDPIAAMGFRFSCLRLVRRDKLDLQYFITNHFPGTYLNAMLMAWKRLIVHPFAADCRAVARLGLERTGSAEWIDVPPFIEELLTGPFQPVAFGPRAWTDADDERDEEEAAAPPPASAAPAAAGDLGATLAELDAALAGVADADLRAELAVDVEALRLEATRPTRKAARFLARLDAIAARAEGLSDACGAVRTAWGDGPA